jgi:hypothetical protein
VQLNLIRAACDRFSAHHFEACRTRLLGVDAAWPRMLDDDQAGASVVKSTSPEADLDFGTITMSGTPAPTPCRSA